MDTDQDILYGLDNGEEMPKAFLTDHLAWDEYVASVWQGMMSLTGIRPNSRVVEIGPGASIKIGGALAAHSFAGELWVVDPQIAVIDVLKPRYQALLPKAKIHYINLPLKEAMAMLPRQPDFVFVNHIIDDMIIRAAAADPARAMSWASAYTNEPHAHLKEVWAALHSDSSFLKRIKTHVQWDLMHLIEDISPKGMIFNQYPSSTLAEHGLDDLNKHSISILRLLKDIYVSHLVSDDIVQAELNKNKHYNNRHIGFDLLNAKNWMVCRQRKS